MFKLGLRDPLLLDATIKAIVVVAIKISWEIVEEDECDRDVVCHARRCLCSLCYYKIGD